MPLIIQLDSSQLSSSASNTKIGVTPKLDLCAIWFSAFIPNIWRKSLTLSTCPAFPSARLWIFNLTAYNNTRTGGSQTKKQNAASSLWERNGFTNTHTHSDAREHKSTRAFKNFAAGGWRGRYARNFYTSSRQLVGGPRAADAIGSHGNPQIRENGRNRPRWNYKTAAFYTFLRMWMRLMNLLSHFWYLRSWWHPHSCENSFWFALDPDSWYFFYWLSLGKVRLHATWLLRICN